jgi:hypothetical protein
MKKIAISISVVALLSVGVGQAVAWSGHTTTTGTKVTVVMKDPGCHWFSVAGKLKTKLAVAGPARLFNVDEAALKIVGNGTIKHVGIGKTITLRRGTYAITMVGQKSDDNHLKLIVR